MELKLERWLSIFEEVDGATLTQLEDDELKENRFLSFLALEVEIDLFHVCFFFWGYGND